MSSAPRASIREASMADEAAVIAIWQQCGLTRPWNDPVADFRLAVAFVASAVLVAEQRGEIIGTAMVGFDGHRGWIYYLAVDPSAAGQGVARALLERCEHWLRDQDCPKAELMVRDGNPAAAFYEHLGWEVQDVRVFARWLDPE